MNKELREKFYSHYVAIGIISFIFTIYLSIHIEYSIKIFIILIVAFFVSVIPNIFLIRKGRFHSFSMGVPVISFFIMINKILLPEEAYFLSSLHIFIYSITFAIYFYYTKEN